MEVDALGVDEREFAEGCFPALDGGALDEFAGCFAGVALGQAGFLGSLAGALVLDVCDGEPQQFGGGRVRGEVAAVGSAERIGDNLT